MQEKTAGISKLESKMAVPFFEPWKSYWLLIFFNSFFVNEIVFIGIKIEPDHELHSLGRQKVDVYVLGEKFIS